LDFAMHGRVGHAGPACEVGEAQFQRRVTEQERKNLALLLRAQNWQEGMEAVVVPQNEEYPSNCGY
jgi:hypothetical protein